MENLRNEHILRETNKTGYSAFNEGMLETSRTISTSWLHFITEIPVMGGLERNSSSSCPSFLFGYPVLG